jgi:hypothetical protein
MTRGDRRQAAERLNRWGVSAGCRSVFAPAQSQLKPACSMSLPADAASTVDTVRPAYGACSMRATSASALHAPVQRVHVSSSPTA